MSLSYETAEYALEERLGERALAHSQGVAETARLLALIYGVDADAARLAGLLHDWHRELDHDELLSTAQDERIEITEADLQSPRLLHSRTGAADLRRVFPEISDEVVSAIDRHTLGDPEMTDLDKIVYVADMIEPARRYPGVDDLREVAGIVSLDDLFAQAYAHTVRHLVEQRLRIHPKTVDVWNRLVAKDER